MLMDLSWPILQPKGRGLAGPELPGLFLVPGLPPRAPHFSSFKQNIQRVLTARSGIQGSACSLPSTSGSLSLAELSSCTGEKERHREGGRERGSRALPWSKARAEMGIEFRDAAVGASSGTRTPWQLGWVLGKSDFLGFRLSNS